MHTALVCDKDIRIREQLKASLHLLGIPVVLLCNQRDNALELAADRHPDLLVLEAEPPVDGIELVARISKKPRTLTVLLVRQLDEALFKQAADGRVDAFLVNPLRQPDPTLALELAIRTARQFAELRHELEATKTALSQRKIVERAKGRLMERERLSEEQAYRSMRRQAMERRISMACLAQEMLETL